MVTAPQLNVTVEPDITVMLDAGETPEADAVNEEIFGVPLQLAGGGGGKVKVGEGGGAGGAVVAVGAAGGAVVGVGATGGLGGAVAVGTLGAGAVAVTMTGAAVVGVGAWATRGKILTDTPTGSLIAPAALYARTTSVCVPAVARHV